jgi:conjugal transfer/entry exclusion protein
MKDEKKTKDQLVKEMQKMREKVAGLEEVRLDYNRVDKELKQTYKKLQKFIECTANIITKVV